MWEKPWKEGDGRETRRQRGGIRAELEEVILDGEMTRNEGRGGETRGKEKTESDVRKRVMRERRSVPLCDPCEPPTGDRGE